MQQTTQLSRTYTYRSASVAALGGLRFGNVIIGLVKMFCTVVAIVMIDRIGRKPLSMSASAGMGTCLLMMGYLFRSPIPSSALILSSILGYVTCFAVGLGPGVCREKIEVYASTKWQGWAGHRWWRRNRPGYCATICK